MDVLCSHDLENSMKRIVTLLAATLFAVAIGCSVDSTQPPVASAPEADTTITTPESTEAQLVSLSVPNMT